MQAQRERALPCARRHTFPTSVPPPPASSMARRRLGHCKSWPSASEASPCEGNAKMSNSSDWRQMCRGAYQIFLPGGGGGGNARTGRFAAAAAVAGASAASRIAHSTSATRWRRRRLELSQIALSHASGRPVRVCATAPQRAPRRQLSRHSSGRRRRRTRSARTAAERYWRAAACLQRAMSWPLTAPPRPRQRTSTRRVIVGSASVQLLLRLRLLRQC